MGLSPTTFHKPRVAARDFAAWVEGQKDGRRAADAIAQALLGRDAFANPAANLGLNSTNLLEGTSYPFNRITFNYILIQSLYRSHWIIRKIIDAPAEDMTKNWLSLSTDLEPDQEARFEKECDLTGTRNAVQTTLKWARLFGGAAGIVIIKGDSGRLDKPLKLEDVEPGSYRGIIPLDRWAGITPGAKLSSDLDHPLDFGLPETYRVTLKTGQAFEIHSSRVVRFIGRDVPSWEKEVEQQWGVSEIEIVFDELRKRDNASWNIASLLFRANIIGIKQNGLNQMLSGLAAAPQVQRNFYATIAAQASLMSNQGLMVLPEDGGLETHPYAFGGLGMVYEQFKEDMAGAAELPYSRLFGRPPGGLATTNEGDEHVYYERIKGRQMRDLNPQMIKLLPIVAMSTWGDVPPDFDWVWKPVATLSSSEQANIAVARTGAATETFNTGAISQKTYLKTLKSMSTETEMWEDITDDDIAAADDRAMSPIEGMEVQAQQTEEDRAFQQESAKAEGEAAGKQPIIKVEGKPEKKPAAGNKKGQDAMATATTGKLSHSDVGYEDPARGPDRCGRCRFFLGSDKCQLVKSPISSGGWCEEFAAGRRANDAALEARSWDFQGLKIDIENLRGSVRHHGNGTTKLTAPYGYIRGTEGAEGADGDAVDVFVGPVLDAQNAYVIHTQDPETGKYDEDKVVLGCESAKEAYELFRENYDRPGFFQSMEKIRMGRLKEKLRTLRGRKLVN